MDKFWSLLESSTLVSGTIALVLVFTACYLWLTGVPTPEQLGYSLAIVLGFFFGAKTQRTASARRG